MLWLGHLAYIVWAPMVASHPVIMTEPWQPSRAHAQVFARSQDGTKVPAFIVSKKGMQLDASNPMLLYGYGGCASAIPPCKSFCCGFVRGYSTRGFSAGSTSPWSPASVWAAWPGSWRMAAPTPWPISGLGCLYVMLYFTRPLLTEAQYVC